MSILRPGTRYLRILRWRHLLEDRGNDTTGYCPPTLTDGEAQAFLHGGWRDQFDRDRRAITWHYHYHTLRQHNRARHLRHAD